MAEPYNKVLIAIMLGYLNENFSCDNPLIQNKKISGKKAMTGLKTTCKPSTITKKLNIYKTAPTKPAIAPLFSDSLKKYLTKKYINIPGRIK